MGHADQHKDRHYREETMTSARTVANYFLTLSDPEVGDIISHLKLQKLLYYAQGLHLAMHGSVLFPEKIFHWKHGPVVADLYYELTKHGAEPLPVPENPDFSHFTSEQTDLLNEVYDVYGQFSAWKLRNMTHAEPPWLETTDGQEISTDRLAAYFKTQLTS
jgi:uncharacterized phage-associated protein